MLRTRNCNDPPTGSTRCSGQIQGGVLELSRYGHRSGTTTLSLFVKMSAGTVVMAIENTATHFILTDSFIRLVQGRYPRAQKASIIPGSDGAGEVVNIGPGVTEFQPGDRVATCFFQDYVSGGISAKRLGTALGSVVDGVFRQYGVFPVHGLVSIPPSLSWREASTLSCAALTAWSCLHGDRPVKPGDTVLIQGTGGVSLFGLQVGVAQPLSAKCLFSVTNCLPLWHSSQWRLVLMLS